jgi:hypothetical protein
VSIWIALWIVLSLLLLAFLGWSLAVVVQQKKVWQAFSEKNKLRFKPSDFLQSPEMDGVIEGFNFSFFTSEHQTQDLRSTRKMMAIEVRLHSVLPIDGGCASGGMVGIFKQLGLKAEICPAQEGWNKTYIAAGSNKRVLEMYLTAERLTALTRLMKIKNVWVIFLFKDDFTLLRIDTSNPLASAEQLERLVKILVATARALELKSGESGLLKAEESKAIMHDNALAVDSKVLDEPIGLELEEDSAEPAKSENSTNS